MLILACTVIELAFKSLSPFDFCIYRFRFLMNDVILLNYITVKTKHKCKKVRR